jgi:hypothetical protein
MLTSFGAARRTPAAFVGRAAGPVVRVLWWAGECTSRRPDAEMGGAEAE